MDETTRALPPADRHSVFAHAPIGVALTTPDGVLLDANPALCRMLDMRPETLHGRSALDLVHPDARAAAAEAHATLAADGRRPTRHETRLLHSAGHELPVQVTAAPMDGSPPGASPQLILIVEDITDRKELEAQLLHRSLHDPLTGLPNRLLLRDRLRHALERGWREHTPTCLLVIDLDRFKAINDTFGHPIGDRALMVLAQRLRAALRASDTAARLGGDEFGVLCENTERSEAEVLAERLRVAVVREPVILDDSVLYLDLSIGIGFVPGGTEPEYACERVVQEADDAMYAIKHRRD